MQVYWLTDLTNGEATLVDGDTVERLLGVELGYVDWCIKVDELIVTEPSFVITVNSCKMTVILFAD